MYIIENELYMLLRNLIFCPENLSFKIGYKTLKCNRGLFF